MNTDPIIPLPADPIDYGGFQSATFRDDVFRTLSRRYESSLAACLRFLEEPFEFPELTHIQTLQNRRELIERQSLPFFMLLEAFAPNSRFDGRILAGCIAAHTLALTQLDYHLDGAVPLSNGGATAAYVPTISSFSYAIRQIYRAAAVMAESSLSGRVIREVLDPISGFVVARMHQDWLSRYRLLDLRALKRRDAIDVILHEPDSRMMASGYWEVMMRAAYINAFPDLKFPDELLELCRTLRIVRQLIDELDDVEEDLRSGLVSLPMAIAVQGPRGQSVLPALERIWQSRGHPREVDMHYAIGALRSKHVAAALGDILAQLAAKYRRLLSSLDVQDDRPLMLLLYIKEAKFASIISTLSNPIESHQHYA